MLLRDLPRVIIKTIDLSEVLLPAVGRTFCVIGPAGKGPVNQPIFVNSAADFIRIFGTPQTDATLAAYLILTQATSPVLFVRAFHPDLIEKQSDEDGDYYVPKDQLLPEIPSYEGGKISTVSGNVLPVSSSLSSFMKEYLGTVSSINQGDFLTWIVNNDKWTDRFSISEPYDKNYTYGVLKIYGATFEKNRETFNYIGGLLKDFGGCIFLDLSKAFEKETFSVLASEFSVWKVDNVSPTKFRYLKIWEIPGVYIIWFDSSGSLADELSIFDKRSDNLFWEDPQDKINYVNKFSFRNQYYKSAGTLSRVLDPLETFKTFVFDIKVYVGMLYERDTSGTEDKNALSVSLLGIADEIPEEISKLWNFSNKIGDKTLILEGDFYLDDRPLTGSPHLDYVWLKNITKYIPGRKEVWVYNNKKPHENGWTREDYLDSLVDLNTKYSAYPNLTECLTLFGISKDSVIYSEFKQELSLEGYSVLYPKNFVVKLVDKYTDLMKNLWKDDYSRDTLYWGGEFNLKTNFKDSAIDQIWKLWEGRTADDKASDICLVGFMDEALKSDLSSSNFTDFWFLLIPTKSLNSSILGKVFNLLANRDEDFIYFPVIEKDLKEDDYLTIVKQVENLPDSPYVAYYWPGVKITHPISGKDVSLPGAVVGAIKFGQLDIYWLSPAGKDRGKIEFSNTVNRRLSINQADILYTDVHVNPVIRPSRGSPLCIWGNRSSYKKGSRVKSALSSINVTSLVIYIKKNLREVLSNFVFEINDPMLFNRFLALFDPFLAEIKRAGGLYDYSLLNATTPEDIDRGEMKIYVAIQPAREVERIYGYIVISRTGARFTLA